MARRRGIVAIQSQFGSLSMVRSISRAWGFLGAVAVLGSWSALSAQSASAIPDLSGVWGRNTIDYTAPATGKGPLKNISGSRNVMVGDYNDPMLKPWAAEIIKRNGEIAKTGDAFPTAHNQCWPEPPPYILGNQQLQALQQKDQALLMYSHGSQVRHVRLNAAHPAKVTPSWYGDSVGHYEGDALVVERYHLIEQAVSTEPRGTGGFRGDDDPVY